MKKLTVLILCLSALSLYAYSPATIQKEVLVKSDKAWDGSELPNYPLEKPEITILKITVPPQTALGWHKHPIINAGYLVSGELTVVSEDGDTLTLKEGDTLIELVEKWHYGKNDTDQPAEIVVFYAGTKNTPVAISKGTEK